MILLGIRLILIRIKNTWYFMWQSFRVIRCYRPLTVLPVLSLVFCVLISIVVLGSGALVFDIPIRTVKFAPAMPKLSLETARHLTLAAIDGLLSGDPDIGETRTPATPAERKTAEHVWLVLFFFYVANSCSIIYFNVAFAHIALDRLVGGRATLDDGLKIAWSRKYSIFQWATLASTVGILLKTVHDQRNLGKWIAGILGYVWKLATFFVMPLLALESIGPGEALHRSAVLIKEKWGDMIVAGFSFPLLFSPISYSRSDAIFLGWVIRTGSRLCRNGCHGLLALSCSDALLCGAGFQSSPLSVR